MYFLTDKDKGCNLPPWELPWVLRYLIKKPADEGGLSLEQHGASYFGPVSDSKLSFECNRLITIYEGVKENGYKPQYEINGFFMGSFNLQILTVKVKIVMNNT